MPSLVISWSIMKNAVCPSVAVLVMSQPSSEMGMVILLR